MAWSEVYNLDVKFPYQFHLHGLSDMQIGSESTSLKIIEQRIDEICSDPVDSGIIICGDIEDEDRPSTRAIRKSAFADREEVIHRDAQKHMAYIDKHVIPYLEPLHAQTKYGIMGILAGHHYTHVSPVLNSAQYICNRLFELTKKKVPYLGIMSAFMDIRYNYNGKGIRSVGHVQHGEGGGQTKASTIAKMERTAQGFDFDWMIRAHDCQLVATKTDKLYPKMVQRGSPPQMMSRTIPMLNLGAATRGYEMSTINTSYVEHSMMRPTTLGWGSLHFSIRKPSRHIDPGMSYRIETKILI